VNEFLEKKTPKELDESCLEEIPEESFMVGLNGGVVPDVSSNAMSTEPNPIQAKE
jgi:hypothetical protein